MKRTTYNALEDAMSALAKAAMLALKDDTMREPWKNMIHESLGTLDAAIKSSLPIDEDVEEILSDKTKCRICGGTFTPTFEKQQTCDICIH